ncbi:MAG: zinc-ribbon domain-containing protein [Candidatus Lokiarchaeia archaeon]
MSFTSKGPKGQPEKDCKPKVDTPKYTPEKGQKKLGDKPTTNPNTKPINKIEPHTIPPNYKPKNKIEQHTLPPNYTPRNKIPRSGDSEVQQKQVSNEIRNTQRPSNEIKIKNTHKIYSENDVKYWIQQYKHYKSFEKVQNHLRDEGKKVPAISTLKNRIKDLIGPEKYKELMKKYNFSDAKKIVKLTGISKTGVPGKILSDPEEFKGIKSKLLYQCGKCNHSWKTTLDAIVNSKHWCPKCATKSRIDAQRGSVGEHQNIITQKGGKLIGVIYEDPKEKLFNQRTRFKIECEAGHKFNIKASNLKQGKWCRKCSYEVIGEKHRGSFQEIQKLIEKRGGHCLSKPEDYKNQHQKLKIRCSENHIFESAPTNFIRGDWCPQCSQGKFERLSRKFFEEIFQKEFPKERPNWLVNSRGNQMELDGYNKDLKLAFEAQGEQHYRAVPHFNQTLDNLEQRIKDDLRKLDLCKQNDVTLIQVPYYIPPSKMQQYIINQYESLPNQKLPNIPDIDYNKFYNTKNDQKKMDNYL